MNFESLASSFVTLFECSSFRYALPAHLVASQPRTPSLWVYRFESVNYSSYQSLIVPITHRINHSSYQSLIVPITHRTNHSPYQSLIVPITHRRVVVTSAWTVVLDAAQISMKDFMGMGPTAEVNALTHVLAHCLTHSLAQPCTHACTHSLPLTLSLIYSLTHCSVM